MYKYTYVYIYTWICIIIYSKMKLSMYIYIYKYIFARMFICTYAHLFEITRQILWDICIYIYR